MNEKAKLLKGSSQGFKDFLRYIKENGCYSFLYLNHNTIKFKNKILSINDSPYWYSSYDYPSVFGRPRIPKLDLVLKEWSISLSGIGHKKLIGVINRRKHRDYIRGNIAPYNFVRKEGLEFYHKDGGFRSSYYF